MFKSLALSAALALLAGVVPTLAAAATCTGQDVIATLPAADRAILDDAVAAAPFPTGNHWRATKGRVTIDVIGTFHLYDARMDGHLNALMPTLRKADAIYLEATDAEFAALKEATISRPELLFTSGATLPERLPEADWQLLSREMTARGVPAFLAAKMQPWYVSVLLAVPPCAMASMAGGPAGMDHMIAEVAKTLGTPTHALEPYDTVFRIFDRIPDADQIQMIRMSLPLVSDAEDMLATMAASYDREEHRQIWEYSRLVSLAATPTDPATTEAALAEMEATLITDRNRAWAEKILSEAADTSQIVKEKHLVIAVGAGHLAGTKGLLNLFKSAGYDLTREAF
jgi:uncharacterized protein